MKKIAITHNGRKYWFSAEEVARHRAEYYAGIDDDTTVEAEIAYAMKEEFELLDWASNNMDPHDLSCINVEQLSWGGDDVSDAWCEGEWEVENA